MSAKKSQTKVLSDLLGEANKKGKLKPKDVGCCRYTDLNGNDICANNFSQFQCQQVAGAWSQGETCEDLAKIKDKSKVEGEIPADVVWAWDRKGARGTQCAGNACAYASLTWDSGASRFLARNNHNSRHIRVTLPGAWGGTSNSVVLAPHQQSYMLFTAFVNPWHADFA